MLIIWYSPSDTQEYYHSNEQFDWKVYEYVLRIWNSKRNYGNNLFNAIKNNEYKFNFVTNLCFNNFHFGLDNGNFAFLLRFHFSYFFGIESFLLGCFFSLEFYVQRATKARQVLSRSLAIYDGYKDVWKDNK